MPAAYPSRKRRSGRGSRASATRSGVRAKGASQTRFSGGKMMTSRNAERSASSQSSGDPRSLFIHHLCHIRAPDIRAAEDHSQPRGKAGVAVGVKLLGEDILGYGEIAASRLKILADGSDVDAGGDQVAQ